MPAPGSVGALRIKPSKKDRSSSIDVYSFSDGAMRPRLILHAGSRIHLCRQDASFAGNLSGIGVRRA
jgi:hypothetical protein